METFGRGYFIILHNNDMDGIHGILYVQYYILLVIWRWSILTIEKVKGTSQHKWHDYQNTSQPETLCWENQADLPNQ